MARAVTSLDRPIGEGEGGTLAELVPADVSVWSSCATSASLQWLEREVQALRDAG